MPADHVISSDSDFQDALLQAAALVEERPSRLVTFGIRPSYPAESFGYIERDARLERPGQYRVKQFREKPKLAVAKQYVDSGNFYWNSGIFVWRAQTILDLLAKHEADMYAHLELIAKSMGTPAFSDTFRAEFEKIKGTSIDFAVMERAEEVVVIEAPFQWDDVGSWQSLERLRGTDEDGNTLVGMCLTVDTHGSIIRSEGDHLIATIGMKDCIVVHTPTATLVANKHDEESVRKIVKLLGEQGLQDYL
jgi:mannose-1-phosphate guanylyltransferase